MGECVFCRIIAGELPATIVYQDDKVMAFRDIHPVAPTHVLIVSREHIPDLRAPEAADRDLMAAVAKAIRLIAEKEGLLAEGFRVVSNTGVKAGQSVFHLHFHLLGGRELGALG
ncbi:MAG: histidine triad nucleotide-binding protein [Firmicutes bacterium]|nr:histidine triad nucleotide-binding protein [Bacillota bacterium]